MAKKQEQERLDTLQLLKSAIREKRPDRLYFFYGEEVFLLQYYLGQLRKILVDELTESFNFHKLTAENFDVQEFENAVENLPMMAETTMVWVDDIDIFSLSESERERMMGIISDIPEYCTVVFTYETVQWKPDGRYKKLTDAVTRYGTVVEFPKQQLRDLVAWTMRHFAANKKRISQELCAYLIDITGGTMTALAGEISKICAYSGADEICKADIDAVTEPVLDAIVFQITDYLARGDGATALNMLHQLLKMQEEPLAILGVIGAHFRKLGTARILLDSGKNAEDLMRLTGMRDYPARKTIAAARQFSAHFYQCVSELVLETDRRIKTSYDEPERLLELLLMQIAQEAQRD